MNEENMVMTDEAELIDLTDVNFDEPEEEEIKTPSLVKTVAKVALGAATAGVCALAYKKREAITEWRIRRLEKKGFVVYYPGEVDEPDEVELEIVDEDDEETTEE